MKFQDIPADILIVRVKLTRNATINLEEQTVFSIEANSSNPGEFEIRLSDAVVFVRPVTTPDIHRLNTELGIGRTMLSQLANPAADNSIELQVAFFTGECVEMGEVEVGVDEYVENAMARIEQRKNVLNIEHLYGRLNQLCCFQQGDNTFFFLTAGPAIDEELKSAKVATNMQDNDVATERHDKSGDTREDGEIYPVLGNANQTPKTEPTRKNSFGITGDSVRFIATETSLPSGKSIFLATRLTKSRIEPDRALRLAKGNLRFVDWTKAGQVQILAKAQMAALTQDDGSYLKKWDEFGDLEGELLLKHAREVGVLQYSDMEQNRNGTVSVTILQASDSALKVFSKGGASAVKVVDEAPNYLQDECLTFKQFAEGIEKSSEVDKLIEPKRTREEKKDFNVSDFDRETRKLTLKTESLPMGSGTLILSLAGETTQIKRRMTARQLILEGRAANPQLGLLIEEQGQITPTRPQHKVPALTAFVREKVFVREKNGKKEPSPPTVMQEKAIEVALNTPDIALIQGPPGTGKTTVIAAILERLNEMADKRGASIKGQVLLTGFQHDAVENMIERLSLNSIPVPKFGGKRSGTDEDDYSVFERNLEDWCTKLASEIRERNPQIAEIEQEREIKNLCLQYVETPTHKLAANLAGKIASLGVSILGEDGARQAANLAKNLAREERLNDGSNQWLDSARRLRIRPESFADDGPERAADALVDLEDTLDLDNDELELLNKASLWRCEDGTPPFLNDLTELKNSLLSRFSAPPVFRVEKQNDKVIKLAENAIKQIKIAGHSAKDKKSTVLAEFLAELESNPDGMRDAVSNYSFAFAATCQQSVNKGMQKQKGITGRDVNKNQKKMEYEFVIVDEAARVSPRDLMVPMAQGKRIILVGDHRQLPHIIDENVVKTLSEQDEEDVLAKEFGAERDDQSWLNISLFEYMFKARLPELEKQDGIPRRITLDRQYRMHPLLGDFISRNFYERFDPMEKFGSGRPASDFTHNLSDTNGKPVAWLDVSAAKGKHQRSGTSWTRPAEATAIVRQLQIWMNSESGKNLSFGVISFYKAQAELIERQLGIIDNDDKNLRIGTVDSFQGMEFDVVFLSMVRTLPQNWKPKDDDREKQARGLFGHLCLYNRLNVSMSRQKKLLIVAGDSGLLQNGLAAEFVPGLVDFLKLCKAEGVVLSC